MVHNINNGLINFFTKEEYVKKQIKWLEESCDEYSATGFVIGVSGGVDSAVCAALLAKTKYPVTALILPSENNSLAESKQ